MTASPHFPSLPKNWTEKTLKVSESLSMRVFNNETPSTGMPHRSLFLVHGQGEQSGRYQHFPHFLNGIVEAIYAVDLPGHGMSAGIRGHIEKFDDYSSAVIEAFHFAKKISESGQVTEWHWFGHSLGGLITLRTLFREKELPLKSVCVSAPLLGIAVPVPFLKKFFGELVEPLIGRFKLSNELDGSLVSHDPSVVKAYDEDPLNHGFVTPRFFVQLTKELERMKTLSDEFPYPLLMIVPLDDRIVSWQRNIEFFRNLKTAAGKEKQLQTFPGFYHESFNEFGKERAFNALQDWILKKS